MGILLTVSGPNQEAEGDAYYLSEATIRIGRSRDNHIRLEEEHRAVSKAHAEIRLEYGAYHVVDLGSKNGTFLNGSPLEPMQPAELRDGDRLDVGPFHIRCSPQPEEPDQPADGRGSKPAPEPDVPLYPFPDASAPSEPDPFPSYPGAPASAVAPGEPAGSDELTGLPQYPSAPSSRTSAPSAPDEALRQLASAFSLVQEVYDRLPSTEERASFVDRLRAVGASAQDHPATASMGPRTSGGQATTTDDAILDALLQTLVTVIDLPNTFRFEFVGQTIVQKADDLSSLTQDLEKFRERLAACASNESSLRDTIRAISDHADRLSLHQLAMVEGYRESVRAGILHLIEDLEGLVEPAPSGKQESQLSRVMQSFSGSSRLENVRHRLEALKQEDWSSLEMRVFRPAFIKAYLTRMTARR